jgi:hypothetical protein
MLERQREGIAKAKAAGKYKGRPVSIDAAQIRQRAVATLPRHASGHSEGRRSTMSTPPSAPPEALGQLGRGELIHQAAKGAPHAIEVMSLPLIGRPPRVRITRPAMPSRRAPDGSPHASPERPAVARSFTRSVGRQSSFQRQRDAHR